jgi:hypothetical protein
MTLFFNLIMNFIFKCFKLIYLILSGVVTLLFSSTRNEKITFFMITTISTIYLFFVIPVLPLNIVYAILDLIVIFLPIIYLIGKDTL